MKKLLTNNILNIREKYSWKKGYEIIFHRNIKFNDRLLMILITILFIPMVLVLSFLWILLYLPARMFNFIDKKLF